MQYFIRIPMSCLNHLILLYISEVIIELVCREKSESIVFRSTKIRVYRHKKIDNFFGECQSGSISGFNITGFQLRIHRPHFRMTTMRPFSKKKKSNYTRLRPPRNHSILVRTFSLYSEFYTAYRQFSFIDRNSTSYILYQRIKLESYLKIKK